MPPLHRQGRRVSKELLSIMVSPPMQERVVTLFNGGPSRQDLVAKSTCEAELIATSEALQQGENISIVISEMTNACCDIEVSSDNAAALHMVRNGPETAWRTRHISVKALWLHQMSRRGIRFTYQSTSDMAADGLTRVASLRSRMTYVSSTTKPPSHALSRECQVSNFYNVHMCLSHVE